jgi:hypothetical protein
MKKRLEGAEFFHAEEQKKRTGYGEDKRSFKQFCESTQKKMNSVIKVFFFPENEKLLNT